MQDDGVSEWTLKQESKTEIDEIVYELYQITEDEIDFIENNQ